MGPLPLAQDINIPRAVFVVIFLALSLGIHEAAHAWVALKCGDPTARDLGRITLNPIPHIDPIMTILVPGLLLLTNAGFVFGGAKPVPVDYYRLRNPLRDMMLVALAGPISNFLLAIVFLVGLKFAWQSGYEPGMLLWDVLFDSVRFNILLGVFNLIPVPPLDGSRVMTWLLPQSLRPSYQQLERFGLLLVLAVIFMLGPVLGQAMGMVYSVLDTLTGGAW